MLKKIAKERKEGGGAPCLQMGNNSAISSLSLIANLGNEREIQIVLLILKTHMHTAIKHYILATYSDNHIALSHILTNACNQINQPQHPQHPPTRNNFTIKNLIRVSEHQGKTPRTQKNLKAQKHNYNKHDWLKKKRIFSTSMVIKNLIYIGLHSPKHEKLHPFEIVFCEHLSFPHWQMSEQIFYPQVQILHRCIVSSLWAEPIKRHAKVFLFKFVSF